MFAFVLASLLIWFLCWWIRDRCKLENLSDKYVFITGCDTGFGNLAAKSFDKTGFWVLAGCLTEEGAQSLSNETSSRLKTIVLDITKSESIENALNQIMQEVGHRGLWGLVNNAGILGKLGPIDWLRTEHFRRPIEVNLLGSIEVTLRFLPLIKKARGRIVNISSVLGRIAVGSGGYFVSKFGLEGFNDSLRRDMKRFGVKVACIEPGKFETRLSNSEAYHHGRKCLWDDLPPDVRKEYGEDYLKQSNVRHEKISNLLSNRDQSLVVWCMEHALTAKYPRTRYSAGIDAKLVWIPLSYLPTFIADYLLTSDTVINSSSV